MSIILWKKHDDGYAAWLLCNSKLGLLIHVTEIYDDGTKYYCTLRETPGFSFKGVAA
jgi:hypothetical protein